VVGEGGEDKVDGYFPCCCLCLCGGRDGEGDEHGHEEEDVKEEDKQGLVRMVETHWRLERRAW